MQDYKSLHVVAMICATLVDTYNTDTQTDRFNRQHAHCSFDGKGTS